MLEQLDHLLSHFALYLGVAVEVLALALVPLVLLRRKEPSSTFAWILTLVFLPGLGAACRRCLLAARNEARSLGRADIGLHGIGRSRPRQDGARSGGRICTRHRLCCHWPFAGRFYHRLS